MKKLTGAKTRLEKNVQAIINSNIDNEYNCESFLKDLFSGGCQSGIIPELIYYADTEKFFKTHKSEIKVLLKNMLDQCGCSIAELFGDKFDADDEFCEERNNRNLLAWFGFEETARILAEHNGIEV